MAESRYDVVDLFSALKDGDSYAIGIVAAIAAWIVFNVLYKRITGKELVRPKRQSRRVRNRRKLVLFEYERDG